MRVRNIIIAAVVIAGIAVVGIFAANKIMKGSAGSGNEAYVQPVDSVNSAAKNSVNRFSGIVENQKSENIKFDTTLTLKECFVKEGDHVKEGDKLFAYDMTSKELEVQQKELSIEKSRTAIDNSNKQITALTEQMGKANASEQVELSAQILELQAGVAQSEYDIKVANAEIDKMKENIKKSEITAPMAGTVTKISDPLDLSEENGTYMTITADGQFRVKGVVSEQNILEIYEGEEVILKSRVDENMTWKGKISSIETQSKKEEQNQNQVYGADEMSSASKYPFYIELESVDGLMLGQHLIIEEDTGSEALEGIWLQSGWFDKDENGNSYCWVAASPDGTLEKRKVEAGEYDSERDICRVASGLKESEYIAWPDPGLKEGSKVTTSKNVSSSGGTASDTGGAAVEAAAVEIAG